MRKNVVFLYLREDFKKKLDICQTSGGWGGNRKVSSQKNKAFKLQY